MIGKVQKKGASGLKVGMYAPGWIDRLVERRFREVRPGGYVSVSLHKNAFVRLEYTNSMTHPPLILRAEDDDGDASDRIASFRLYPTSSERDFAQGIEELELAAVGALRASWAPLYTSWLWWRLSVLPIYEADDESSDSNALTNSLHLAREYVEAHRDEHAHRIPSFRGDEGARPLVSSDGSESSDVGANATRRLPVGRSTGYPTDSTRSRRSQVEPPPAPSLAPVEVDQNGTVVYVDLRPSEGLSLQAMRVRLSAIRPTERTLRRLPLINRNRVLVEVEDRMALELFQHFLLTSASNGAVGDALGNLLRPLGTRILLLGAHFICPRVTEYEPRILPQTPHTDVGTRGEVIAVGLHLEGEPMNTLLDPHATLDTNGEVQGGSGFRRAHTPVFAFETAAVHAGPGVPHVAGPYPRFLTSRIFFLLAAAGLDPAKVAKHRADNGLAGSANLTIDLPTTP